VRNLFRINFSRYYDNRFFVRWNKNKIFTKLEMTVADSPLEESQSTNSPAELEQASPATLAIAIPLLVELSSELSLEIF
jgi:hypothetical protein